MSRWTCPFVTSLCALLMIQGCALPRENALFVTRTSLSVFDLDATPASASIAYDRVEGFVGPRFDDGSVFPVAGSIESNGKGFDRVVRQTYATGKAAELITDNSKAANDKPVNPQKPVGPDIPSDRKVLIFATATTAGLKLSFAENTPVPTSFSLGYKRKELSIIPVDRDRHPSVLATYDNSAGVTPSIKDPLGATAFGVQQFFATGAAAENLARNPDIGSAFTAKAKQAINTKVAYRTEEALQGRLSLDALACFVNIDDNRLDRVWINAEDLQVFGDRGTIARIRADKTRAQQRARYTGEMSLLEPDSVQHTSRLSMHKDVVCRLAGA